MTGDCTRKGRCEEAFIANFNLRDTLNKEKESRPLTGIGI